MNGKGTFTEQTFPRGGGDFPRTVFLHGEIALDTAIRRAFVGLQSTTKGSITHGTNVGSSSICLVLLDVAAAVAAIVLADVFGDSCGGGGKAMVTGIRTIVFDPPHNATKRAIQFVQILRHIRRWIIHETQ